MNAHKEINYLLKQITEKNNKIRRLEQERQTLRQRAIRIAEQNKETEWLAERTKA